MQTENKCHRFLVYILILTIPVFDKFSQFGMIIYSRIESKCPQTSSLHIKPYNPSC